MSGRFLSVADRAACSRWVEEHVGERGLGQAAVVDLAHRCAGDVGLHHHCEHAWAMRRRRSSSEKKHAHVTHRVTFGNVVVAVVRTPAIFLTGVAGARLRGNRALTPKSPAEVSPAEVSPATSRNRSPWSEIRRKVAGASQSGAVRGSACTNYGTSETSFAESGLVGSSENVGCLS